VGLRDDPLVIRTSGKRPGRVGRAGGCVGQELRCDPAQRARGRPGSRSPVAAYNAGNGGALQGFQTGDVDRYTTGRDYSAWVLRHRLVVQHWLDAHPTWKPSD
jgi:hypothetical protein